MRYTFQDFGNHTFYPKKGNLSSTWTRPLVSSLKILLVGLLMAFIISLYSTNTSLHIKRSGKLAQQFCFHLFSPFHFSRNCPFLIMTKSHKNLKKDNDDENAKTFNTKKSAIISKKTGAPAAAAHSLSASLSFLLLISTSSFDSSHSSGSTPFCSSSNHMDTV